MTRIYLDNAATSYPKAPGVSEAVRLCLDELSGSVNRSGFNSPFGADELVWETREKVAGEGKPTREINLHFACYETNPDIKCVFHAHAPNAMFWATSHLDLPNLSEATQKVEHIKVLDFAPNTTPELAEIVRQELLSAGKKLPKEYLLDSHGILVLTPGADGEEALNKALQIIDTVEWNAEIAYKQTIFQKLGILDGYYSKGRKVGNIDDLINHRPIWNQENQDEGYE